MAEEEEIEDMDDEGIKEFFRILSAYYFPEGGNKALSNDLTPVNNFRIMFNYYFNGDYKILDNHSYYCLEEDYHFQRGILEASNGSPNNYSFAPACSSILTMRSCFSILAMAKAELPLLSFAFGSAPLDNKASTIEI